MLTLTLVLTGALSSCESKSTLVKKLDGTWATNPQSVKVGDALNAMTYELYQFTPNDGDSPVAGTITISATLTVTNEAPVSDLIVQPYSVTASGIGTVKGTWEAVDHDKIMVSLDPQSLYVYVDTTSVVMKDNILTGENVSDTSTLKPAIAEKFRSEILTYMGRNYLNIKEIDDIEIKGNEMKFEVHDNDVHLNRQETVELNMKK